jgi:hypothetical protein
MKTRTTSSTAKAAWPCTSCRTCIGEDKVNAALKDVLNQYGRKSGPYPSVTVLVDALRKITPADQAYLIDDLFNNIVLYENHAVSATARKLSDGRYEVSFTVSAAKVRAGEQGEEKDVPLRDWIDVGVDDKDGSSLLRERMLIAQKENRYTVVVNGRPAKAGIDPDNKLIDRKPDDNMINVELQAHKPAAATSCAVLMRCAAASRRLMQLEHRDNGSQRISLIVQRACCGGGFFHQRRILLRHLVHLADGLVDLLDTAALLQRSRGDFAHDVGHALDAVHHLAHGAAGLRHQRAAGVDLLQRVIDQRLDLLGRRRAALRQVAHFRRHHRKATALLAGTRRFHRRVQRQDIGLERDAVDHADDVGNLARRTGDGIHGRHHFRHHAAAALRHFRRLHRQLIGLARVVGILLHGRGQLFHRRRGFFQAGRLLFGTARQVQIAGRDLARCGRNALRAIAHFGHDADQAIIHLLQGLQQAAGFILLVTSICVVRSLFATATAISTAWPSGT